MDKFIDKVQAYLLPIAEKLASVRFLNALSRTFQLLLPIFMIGSFAALGAFLDVKPWQSFVTSTGLAGVLMGIQSITLSIIAFYVLLVLPYQYATELKINAMSATILTVMVFLTLTPTELYTSIPMEWLGYAGLFGTMILCWLVPLAIKFLIDKKIYIRMPKGVPTVVEDSFASLVPAILLIVVAYAAKEGLALTSFKHFHNVVYSLIQIPLSNIGLSYPAYLLMQIIATLVMFCGIHSNSVFSIITPLAMSASVQNVTALQNGMPLPNIITNSFSLLCQPGGVGGTLGLAFLMAFIAKSNRLKKLGRLSAVPAIFGINEPIIFGAPLLLNPIMFIPYILNPIICTTISYFAIWSGLIPRLTGTDVNWTMPQVISGFLAQGWQAAVLQAILIVITTVMWIPFFRILDRKYVQEEQVSIESN